MLLFDVFQQIMSNLMFHEPDGVTVFFENLTHLSQERFKTLSFSFGHT